MRKFGKWAVALVVVALLCAMVVVAGAETTIIGSGSCGKNGDNVTWTVDNNGTLTISGTGAMASGTFDMPLCIREWLPYIDVQRIVIEEGVTDLGTYVFTGWAIPKSVSIPSTVTSISSGAFLDCIGLTSVSISNGVTSIGGSAFSNCENLTAVKIPSSVKSIGGGAFNGCENLKSISVPDSVTSFGNSMFAWCYSLEDVKLPAGLTSIPDWTFAGCERLTSVTIPSSVTSIGENAFNGCGLTSVTIPSGVTSIGESAFAGSSLTSVTMPSGVTSIGAYAFEKCTKLSGVTIPSGVTTIGASAFYDCASLKSVSISSTVKEIGDSAFANCPSLKSVTIPKNVTSIGLWAFGCLFDDEHYFTGYSDLTISGEYGTEAEYYAGECGLPFIATGGTPTLLKAPKITALKVDGSTITIMWDKVRGARMYRLFLMVEGSWQVMGNTTFCDVTIDGAEPGVTYTFTVCCVDNEGNMTSEFDDTGMSVTVPLDVPKLSSVTNTAKGVTIKWSKVKDAENYRVYYKTTGGWKKLADTTSTSYTWTKAQSGTKYTFTVRCMDKDGKNAASDYDKTGKSITYLATPKLSSVTNTATGVTIKWGKVTGAAQYRVYYKTTGSWKKLTDTKSTSYTWTKAQSGTKYSFTVQSLSSTGKTTSAYDTTGKSITYLAQPKLSSVTNAATGITIKWGKVTGAAKYRVYYKTTGGWKKLTETKSTSYTWTKAKSGTKYSFTVASLSSTGKTVSAYDTTGKSITYLAQPKLSSVTATSKGIAIKWGKVTGAAQYRVYYKTTGGWKKLTETKSTSYTWTKGKKGVKYTFTVCSLSSTGKTASTYDTKGKSVTLK